MRSTFCLILFLMNSIVTLYAENVNDSLLRVLDKVISERQLYTEKKQTTIKELKLKKSKLHTLDELYQLNAEIISQYETFICDSAEYYIHENIRITEENDDKAHWLESKLHLAFVYSLSGLFVQANDIFKSIRCDSLPGYLQALYCWNRIRYYENLINYTDDIRFRMSICGKKRPIEILL